MPTPEAVKAYREKHNGEEHPMRELFISGDVRAFFQEADDRNNVCWVL